MGRLLIIVGILTLSVGLLMEYAPNIPLGKLPGDIRIERENFRVYFPITTCILLSLLLMLGMYVWNKIKP